VDVSGWPGGFVSWETINQAMIYTLDPAHPDMADFWLWRDRLLTAETDPPLDGLYFDLGFSVVVWSCYDHLADADHGHPSGAGRWMIQSVRDILNQSRGTLNRGDSDTAPRTFRNPTRTSSISGIWARRPPVLFTTALKIPIRRFSTDPASGSWPAKPPTCR
jgi:hypothetical protein